MQREQYGTSPERFGLEHHGLRNLLSATPEVAAAGPTEAAP